MALSIGSSTSGGSHDADSSTSTVPTEQSSATLPILDGLPLEEYIAQPRFHNKFTYFSEVAQKEIVASYSLVGNQAVGAPTYLYFGGIFGGRYHGMFADYLCKQKGIKGLFPDRPGLGLFTPVPMEQRTAVLIESIPEMLKHAGIEQVSVMALSGGAIYLLNLLWHHPECIDSEQSVYMLSPWVHPSKSGIKLHSMMAFLPSSLTRGATKMAAFLLKMLLARMEKETEGGMPFVKNPPGALETCGAPATEISKHRQAFAKHLFSENTSGTAEDYLMSIKDPRDTWGVCADYAAFARRLAQRCKETNSKVNIRVLFAAGDGILGQKGIQYFNEAFGKPKELGYSYSSDFVEGTDHEGIAYPETGVVGKLMEEVARIAALPRQH